MPTDKKPDVMQYLVSQGTRCPVCDSKDIEGGNVDYDTPMSQDVECNDCGYKWKDVLEITDILDEEGSPVDGGPRISPLKLFGCYWVGAVRDGEMEISGPYNTQSGVSTLSNVAHLHEEREKEKKGADYYLALRLDMQTGQMIAARVEL